MDTGDLLSVVIPSWREGPRLLGAIRAARASLGQCEVIVVASEEPDDIRQAALAEGALWLDSPRPCRGLQLRMGAAAARGNPLVFVHVDTRLPLDAGRVIGEAFTTRGVVGGAFRLRFDRSHVVFGLLSWLSALTFPTTFLGDQCLFCSREAYVAAGGFREMLLFEDVDLAQRLAHQGRLLRLPQAVTTSARRFAHAGPFRQLLTNAFLMCGFHAGISTDRLHAIYSRRNRL